MLLRLYTLLYLFLRPMTQGVNVSVEELTNVTGAKEISRMASHNCKHQPILFKKNITHEIE